jgi:hypothetical protein
MGSIGLYTRADGLNLSSRSAFMLEAWEATSAERLGGHLWRTLRGVEEKPSCRKTAVLRVALDVGLTRWASRAGVLSVATLSPFDSFGSPVPTSPPPMPSIC